MDDFVIDKLSWYIGKGIHHDPHQKFRILLDFLVENNLLNSSVEIPVGIVPDNFELNSAHLTAEGLLLIKATYQKWLKSIDRGNCLSWGHT